MAKKDYPFKGYWTDKFLTLDSYVQELFSVVRSQRGFKDVTEMQARFRITSMVRLMYLLRQYYLRGVNDILLDDIYQNLKHIFQESNKFKDGCEEDKLGYCLQLLTDMFLFRVATPWVKDSPTPTPIEQTLAIKQTADVMYYMLFVDIGSVISLNQYSFGQMSKIIETSNPSLFDNSAGNYKMLLLNEND